MCRLGSKAARSINQHELCLDRLTQYCRFSGGARCGCCLVGADNTVCDTSSAVAHGQVAWNRSVVGTVDATAWALQAKVGLLSVACLTIRPCMEIWAVTPSTALMMGAKHAISASAQHSIDRTVILMTSSCACRLQQMAIACTCWQQMQMTRLLSRM
jgi:hypothetical protein